MEPVIITAATARELGLLLQAAEGRTERLPGGWECRVGTIRGRDVVIAETGLGKVNTAGCIAQLLSRHPSALLVNTGCGGAYRGSGLSVGDIAVADSEIYADEGVLSREGWQPLDCIGIPLWAGEAERCFNSFRLSSRSAEAAADAAAALGFTVRRGPFATVSACSGTDERGDELERRFGVICENMEGAAAAHLAARHGVACLELRGISNMVENRDLSRWDIDIAVANVQKVLLRLLEMPA
ncbi:futalosine hydrolase [Geobacter sp. DSM 9736]|uniref:futalosine hydrolase n=1 Tax=Geobacter sp. DSM 9736 TaxID=1277350 RepID=UPI000B4FDE98|nr:futalosine hydrolase [Geobacter sp. DSM 9736]SNB47423.1 futalosine hydrolase [Geobacter sp. DSM 9736]